MDFELGQIRKTVKTKDISSFLQRSCNMGATILSFQTYPMAPPVPLQCKRST